MTRMLVGARTGLRALGRSHWPTAILFVLLLAAVGALLRRQGAGASLTPTWRKSATALAQPMPNSSQGAGPLSPLSELASLVERSMRSSRPVLLGSRDPRGPSCVPVVHTGDVGPTLPDSPGDLNGGPGTTFATIYFFDRREIKSPHEDYIWHQTRLKTWFENESAENEHAGKLAHELAEKARLFYDAINQLDDFPSDLVPVKFTEDEQWPGYCMTALDKAVAAKDFNGVKHWAGELASAAFSLDDLHRWLGFLVENHLAALEFQQKCESLFLAADELGKPYDPQSTISQFPAGVLSLNGKGNYYEVEHQAERLFSMPAERLAEIGQNRHLTPASLWVPPSERDCFLKLQSALSPANQKVWEAAAREPYQHSYLVNMLFRADHAETGDDLYTVLRKFDALHPHATSGELMNVLMYRGHSFAGLEWGDRFQPELLQAANEIKPSETDLEAFQAAWKWTNQFYEPDQYGVTFTLRDALKQKRLDCVRATDMIASIYRNAGRVGLGHVRWCSETGGHSVAAHLSSEGDHIRTLLGDGLTSPHEPEVWPECYFHGHAWPPGLENNAPPYAAELYLRGIDGYIWAQGYIIRGPNAGTLASVDIPYSTHHHEQFAKKVFDGPYPQ
jgi:hypothetical protein